MKWQQCRRERMIVAGGMIIQVQRRIGGKLRHRHDGQLEPGKRRETDVLRAMEGSRSEKVTLAASEKSNRFASMKALRSSCAAVVETMMKSSSSDSSSNAYKIYMLS